jgi:carbonic anhydrase
MHDEIQVNPAQALAHLKAGNRRFVEGRRQKRALMEQVAGTSQGQSPFAVVLGCVDSRVPPELVFDQGIGDIFSLRVAGNIVNGDILGSMEFACKLAGAKLIVVLGHTGCGAVRAAYDGIRLGHFSGLLGKIMPAVEAAQETGEIESDTFLDEVAKANVLLAIANIEQSSPILNGMLDGGEIAIVGAMYDVSSGRVKFL